MEIGLLMRVCLARFSFLILTVALGVLTGCGGTGDAKSVEDLMLTVALDKPVYRPGEAVVATVTLANNTNASIDLPELDADSVRFWFGATGDPEKMERQAVSSPKDPKGRIRPVPPGDTLKRVFLLTTLTHYKGSLTLQAHYNPEIPMVKRDLTKAYSNAQQYDVSGEVLFERDGTGLIQKEEAIGLARAKAGQEVKAADVFVIKDEMDFYKYWVNLQRPDDQYISYLIDPYIGRVWSEAKPFNPALLKDPRRDVKMEDLMKLQGAPRSDGPGIE